MSRRVHNDQPPAWMQDGALCWYYPSAISDERFAGVIDGDPRRLGDSSDSSWVVRLRDMVGYRDGTRKTVAAASCWAIEQREPTLFPDADFYDCCDRETLTFESPEEALEEDIERWLTPKCDVSAVIRERAPWEVKCHRRSSVPDKWVDDVAEGLLERIAEDFAENWGDPDGGDDGIDGFSFADCRADAIALVRRMVKHATVWPCKVVATVSLDAETTEKLMREHRPEWWEEKEVKAP